MHEKNVIFLLVLACGTVLPAQPRLKPEELVELHLTDGRVLSHVEIVGYASQSFTARWDGGRGTVSIAQLPPELRGRFAVSTPAVTLEKSQPAGAKSPLQNPLLVAINQQAPAVSAPHFVVPYKHTGHQRTIAGRVFLTLNDGRKIPLAGVKVGVYPRDSLVEYQAWRLREGIALGDYYRKKAIELRLTEDRELLLAFMRAIPAADHQSWDYIPAPLAFGVTDADGRYRLHHDSDGINMIFAKATWTYAENRTEYLLWALDDINVSANGELMLQNDNQGFGR